jgi:hypothetical protein
LVRAVRVNQGSKRSSPAATDWAASSMIIALSFLISRTDFRKLLV